MGEKSKNAKWSSDKMLCKFTTAYVRAVHTHKMIERPEVKWHILGGPYLGVVSDAKRWLGVVSEAKANRIFMSDLAFENCLGLILSICIAVAAHVPRRA